VEGLEERGKGMILMDRIVANRVWWERDQGRLKVQLKCDARVGWGKEAGSGGSLDVT